MNCIYIIYVNSFVVYIYFCIQNDIDLLTKLLIRDPKLRLGSGERDALDIQEHPAFEDFDWEILATGRASVPWIPDVSNALDSKNFDKEFTSMNPAGLKICLKFFVF
jgi:hypothetical protein